MYDDYIELQPGAAERFESKLREYFECIVVDDLGTTKDTPTRSLASTAITWLKRIRQSNHLQVSKLPRHHSSSQRSASQLGACPISPDTPPGDHNYVLLCVPFLRTLKLYQPEVCKMNSDREIFRVLRYYYASQRKTSPWSRLRTVRAINFIKVGYHHISLHPTAKLMLLSLRHIKVVWLMCNRAHPFRRRVKLEVNTVTIPIQQRQTRPLDLIF